MVHWVGRSGRMIRLVVGAEAPPASSLLVPDAPVFTADEDAARVSGGRFSILEGHKEVLAGSARSSPYSVELHTHVAEIHGFGAGQKALRNGSQFRVMTMDTLFMGLEGTSYTALPLFFIRDGRNPGGTGVSAVLVLTSFPLDAECREGVVRLRSVCDTEGAPVDLVLLRGTTAEIFAGIGALLGTSFLPPAWALGFHQSRWSYKSSGEVLDVARRFRKEDLPADVIHLDIHYMDKFRVFTWDKERFPHPRKMHDELHALGFRTMAIIDPGVSVTPGDAVYEEVKGQDMLLKRRDGTPYEGKVWPGATVFPDFTVERVRDAWGGFHKVLTDAGVAGVWNDMNDPVFHVGRIYDPLLEDVRHADGSHKKLRNTYATRMAQATAAGLRKLRPDKRPFVLTRSGGLGIQRHAAVWTGDNFSSWEQLQENLYMVLHLGLSGVAISGADVGGFAGRRGLLGMAKLRPPAELFVRWMELGALLPFFRVHSVLYGPRQEPWQFGDKALSLSRRQLRRRYRLLPLLYRTALEAHETGLPIVRPLWLHHDVPPGRGEDQFLVGDTLLAAPVMQPGRHRREVWLPPGGWIDFDTGEALVGDRHVMREAPLGTMPLLVRGGAALWLAEPRRNADETLRAPLALEVSAPIAGALGGGSLFLDDGETSSGARFLLDVVSEDEGGRLRLRLSVKDGSFTPAQTDFELRAPTAYRHAVVDGERRALQPRALGGEGRSATFHCTRVSLAAREIVLE